MADTEKKADKAENPNKEDIDKVLKGEARVGDPDVDTRMHPPDTEDKKTGEK